MRHARFVVVEDSFTGDDPLVIRDVGPWDKHPTITNDAEYVVATLLKDGRLMLGQRLLYYGSGGEFAEILIRNGKFQGFAPGPGPQA